MGIVDKIHEKIRKKAGKIRAAIFHFFPDKSELINKSGSLLEDKKRLLLIGAGILSCILLFCFLVIFMKLNSDRRASARAAMELAESFKPLPVEPDELFWPEEPDFVPKVQLDREPRKAWTEADAVPYWIDPKKNYEKIWKERIFSVMDDMMEKVP